MNPSPARVYEALRPEWQTTPEIARRLGIEWRPGGSGLRALRRVLFALYIFGGIEHDPRHNGHRWRRPGAAKEFAHASLNDVKNVNAPATPKRPGADNRKDELTDV